MSANDLTPKLAPHYATAYIHWDLVLNTRMGYLEGCATKYVSRWRKKGGIQDLEKALHYVNKSLENVDKVLEWRKTPNTAFVFDEVLAFGRLNQLSELETKIVRLLASWGSEEDLHEARDLMVQLLEAQDALNPPASVPLEDSNKHADRE